MSAALVQLGTLQDASRAQQLLLHCSTSQKLELLDSVFKANLYKPQDVVKHGRDLLKRGYLGNAKYRIQEQTCVACIDIGLWADAEEIIKSLKQSFPQSIRVKRLEGLLLEARPAAGEQKYDRARKLYDEILKADEANLLTHKRKVAMLKQDGKIAEAVKVMNADILKDFSSDESSWEELAELYVMLGHFKHAVFCMEEVFMAKPFYHTHCTKLADLCYSADDLDAARSYYSMSLQLKPNGNLRAAWGLALATSHTAAAAAPREQGANAEALNAIAVRTLGEQYDALKNPQLAQVVRAWAGR